MATQYTRTPIAKKHAYRPIAFYNGSILKCAGHQSTQEGFDFFDAFYKAGPQPGERWDDTLLPGVVWLDEYLGDRITADTHELFTRV